MKIEPLRGAYEKLRELDRVDVDFGADYENRLHQRIMMKIDQTSMQEPKSKKVARAQKAVAPELKIISRDR